METILKRGLGIVTDLQLKSTLLKGINKLSIEGAYSDIKIDDDLACVNDAKQDVKHNFDKLHFDNCDTRCMEIKGNTIIDIDLEYSSQLILCIEQDANIKINLTGNGNNFLSSGLFIHVHNGVTSNIQIKSELKSSQNYVRIIQKQEENTTVNVALQLYAKNQTLLFYKTNMVGENSSLDKRVFIKGINSSVDSDISISHDSPRTKSNMIVNGTLENSKIINENSIDITKHADTCEGYEHSKFVMLDDYSDVISIPNLEISNNNVSCSHGSSISSVGDEELFYLQSRGLTKKTATELIVAGLENSVVDHILVGGLNE